MEDWTTRGTLTSASKVEDGLRLGAHEVVLSRDPVAMSKHERSFDFILDCVSAEHDINAYLQLIKLNGTLTTVGAPEKPLPVSAFSLIGQRRSFAGSGIGSIAETQEMLDFCAQHNITPDIERLIRLGDAWIAGDVPNLPVRLDWKSLDCAVGDPTFAEGAASWRKLTQPAPVT